MSKSKKINSSESSIINHIYDVVHDRPIPFKVKKLSGVIDLPEDFDFDRDYTAYLQKKYK